MLSFSVAVSCCISHINLVQALLFLNAEEDGKPVQGECRLIKTILLYRKIFGDSLTGIHFASNLYVNASNLER